MDQTSRPTRRRSHDRRLSRQREAAAGSPSWEDTSAATGLHGQHRSGLRAGHFGEGSNSDPQPPHWTENDMLENLAVVGGPKTPVAAPVLIGFFALVVVAIVVILFLRSRSK